MIHNLLFRYFILKRNDDQRGQQWRGCQKANELQNIQQKKSEHELYSFEYLSFSNVRQ